MADHGRAGGADAEFEKITAAALHPNGVLSRTNQLLQAGGLVGRRDPLSELQQQLIIAAIARIDHPLDFDRQRSTGKMPWRDFLALCAGETADATVLTGEIEKNDQKRPLVERRRGPQTDADILVSGNRIYGSGNYLPV